MCRGSQPLPGRVCSGIAVLWTRAPHSPKMQHQVPVAPDASLPVYLCKAAVSGSYCVSQVEMTRDVPRLPLVIPARACPSAADGITHSGSKRSNRCDLPAKYFQNLGAGPRWSRWMVHFGRNGCGKQIHIFSAQRFFFWLNSYQVHVLDSTCKYT